MIFLVAIASAFTYHEFTEESNPSLSPVNAKTHTWTDISTASTRAKKDHKKILVDVYTDWCKWCKVMDKETFENAVVSNIISTNFHLAKLNAEQKEIIEFKGKKYTFSKNGRRGYHELAAQLLEGQLAYPSLVVLDSELNTLEVIRGFKSPEDLLQILDEYLTNT